MSMLYNKIKFNIDISNDELLKTIQEHMKEIKKGGGGGGDIIKLMNLHLLYHYSYFFSHFQSEA
jgi:hypothetical protein